MERTLLRGHRVSNPEPPELPSREDQAKRQDAAPPAGSRRIINSQELLGDDQEVLIQNGDEMYRLRRTRAGKLILYK